MSHRNTPNISPYEPCEDDNEEIVDGFTSDQDSADQPRYLPAEPSCGYSNDYEDEDEIKVMPSNCEYSNENTYSSGDSYSYSNGDIGRIVQTKVFNGGNLNSSYICIKEILYKMLKICFFLLFFC